MQEKKKNVPIEIMKSFEFDVSRFIKFKISRLVFWLRRHKIQ